MYSFNIYVSGVVQGVGFRPFIKRIALKSGVYGYVQNLGGGEVLIHLEGDKISIRKFFRLFKYEKPPPAEVSLIKVYIDKLKGYRDFKILKSGSQKIVKSMIPPDIGICRECIKEIDSDTRWRRYPFNSCAWCGPRFSMMYKIPYDRENTSMIMFPLCRKCSEEYSDVNNIRRFHAQGISCPECGPSLWLTYRDGMKIDIDDPIREAAKLIDEGYIVGIKGLGGFHIACRADDDEVLNRLRVRKMRPYKPFALMALSINIVKRFAEVDDEAEKLLESPQRPILLLPLKDSSKISRYVAPGLAHIGVMLPYTGIHYLLLKDTREKYLIMTSGNYYGKPMEIDNKSAIKRIGEIVDYFLLHNRNIVNRVDDSVIRFSNGRPTFLRRGRGYAPKWIKIPNKLPYNVIAFGAELQNTGAIGFDDKIILTQYIGDVDDYDALNDLDKYLNWFVTTYGLNPGDSILVIDKHPKYGSTLLGVRWSNEYGSKLIKIQHHVAHGYSILAEYGMRRGIIISIDGAGYGDDGNVWGGEVLSIYEDGSYERIGHLEYYKMLGGDLATIYPVRMLFSIISEAVDSEYAYDYIFKNGYLEYLRNINELNFLKELFNMESIYTSSLGRALDAYSALLKICGYRSYEGEPAMKLEAFSYGGSIIKELLNTVDINPVNSSKVIEIKEFFIKSLDIIKNGLYSKRDLAYTFQYILGYKLASIAVDKARELGEKYIYISGGAAVNDIILKGVEDYADKNNIILRTHRLVPPGDGGISLGQVYYISYLHI